MKTEVMHEEMSRKEDMEQRWSTKDQDVALKLQELSVETAGGRGISCCHKSHRQLPAEIDPPTFCYTSPYTPLVFYFLTKQLRHFSARKHSVVTCR